MLQNSVQGRAEFGIREAAVLSSLGLTAACYSPKMKGQVKNGRSFNATAAAGQKSVSLTESCIKKNGVASLMYGYEKNEQMVKMRQSGIMKTCRGVLEKGP